MRFLGPPCLSPPHTSACSFTPFTVDTRLQPVLDVHPGPHSPGSRGGDAQVSFNPPCGVQRVSHRSSRHLLSTNPQIVILPCRTLANHPDRAPRSALTSNRSIAHLTNVPCPISQSHPCLGCRLAPLPQRVVTRLLSDYTRLVTCSILAAFRMLRCFSLYQSNSKSPVFTFSRLSRISYCRAVHV